jgi:hypothetical protein
MRDAGAFDDDVVSGAADAMRTVRKILEVTGPQPSHEELQELCNTLMDEFFIKGTDANTEPTEYGIEIEHLIDKLNPFSN